MGAKKGVAHSLSGNTKAPFPCGRDTTPRPFSAEAKAVFCVVPKRVPYVRERDMFPRGNIGTEQFGEFGRSAMVVTVTVSWNTIGVTDQSRLDGNPRRWIGSTSTAYPHRHQFPRIEMAALYEPLERVRAQSLRLALCSNTKKTQHQSAGLPPPFPLTNRLPIVCV
jgi:hypothetical protein